MDGITQTGFVSEDWSTEKWLKSADRVIDVNLVCGKIGKPLRPGRC